MGEKTYNPLATSFIEDISDDEEGEDADWGEGVCKGRTGDPGGEREYD